MEAEKEARAQTMPSSSEVTEPALRNPVATRGEHGYSMPADRYGGMYGSSSGPVASPAPLDPVSSENEISGYAVSGGSAQYAPRTYDSDMYSGGYAAGGQGGMGSGMRSAEPSPGNGQSSGMAPEGMPTRADQGLGPGMGGDRYATIDENPFIPVKNEPLSTFSIDVDTASYSKVRQYLLEHNMLPRPDAVRIEELINYFRYEYEPPAGNDPFAAHIEVAECPWTPAHRLVRVGIKGREVERDSRPTSNLVFLLDVSGSMDQPNKLPLLKRGMKMLVDQLGENDRVAIVVYAGAAGMVLDSTTGDRKPVIMEALDRLQAGGSTNGGQGIRLAYQAALDHFVQGGVNRVILCTDGDFNVGVTGTDELVRLVEENAKRGVFLTVLGFGMGNHNDAMLEELSNKGNGNYAFIDTDAEARKVLVEQLSGTLVTIAKDVKIQVEFNPAQASAYRLIGYENRLLAAQDFNDDGKDAGEIGAGHTVTALYEIVPTDAAGQLSTPPVDDLRYQQRGDLTGEARSGELLTLKIRYKQPDGDTSTKLTFPVADLGYRFGQASKDFRFAAAVASFGMLLRNSQHQGNATYASVLEIAAEAAEGDPTGYRQEFLALVRAAMAQAERRQ
ncbi:MAG: von Willebrand factor type A domain-containing protein [Pirellulaceae bacterium]|nr:von Willebrand factor type A domain-containing protein [Pirellulaceae bacterium]